jgi:hypothetical protein
VRVENVCEFGAEADDDTDVSAEATLRAGEADRGFDVEFDVEFDRDCEG